MAVMITDLCINCDACIDECPAMAIVSCDDSPIEDASFIKAIPKDGGKFGYTGIIESIDPTTIENLINEKFIPVIAPIGSANELDHPGFNINADVCACEVAIAVQAEKVIFLTDTVGVLDNDKNLIQTLREADINRLKDEKVIVGGMIPKVESCLKAINNGVKKAHIIDGRIEHSILLELLTNEGIGTAILPTQN
jgi:acetylglutamate kinase